MKLQQKKMPAKKQKQPSNATYDNDLVIDISDYGAAQPYDNISYTSGIDTITLDPSIYSTSSITVPSTVSTTIGSGASTAYSWTQDYSMNTASIGNAKVKIGTDGLEMADGTDIKIGGRSLNKVLEALEDKLGILYPNDELESKWGELREARRRYVELEKELLEKEKMWKILKEN